MLGNFWHPCCAASVKQRRDAVFLDIFEIQCCILLCHLSVEIKNLGLMRYRVFGPKQRHQPTFGWGEIPIQVDLKHRMDVGCIRHSLRGGLRHFTFWKSF